MHTSVSGRDLLDTESQATDLGFWKQEVVETRHLSLVGAPKKRPAYACLRHRPPVPGILRRREAAESTAALIDAQFLHVLLGCLSSLLAEMKQRALPVKRNCRESRCKARQEWREFPRFQCDGQNTPRRRAEGKPTKVPKPFQNPLLTKDAQHRMHNHQIDRGGFFQRRCRGPAATHAHASSRVHRREPALVAQPARW